MNREFLQLAQVFDREKHGIAGWYISEKLDGQRCYWDGGITRGQNFLHVPWANTAKDQRAHKCTGLWSRLAKPIFAPDWFLDLLPKGIPLDGELYWLNPVDGRRQDLRSIISKHTPDPAAWKQVGYFVFDTPIYERVLAVGKVNNPNCKMQITEKALAYVKALYPEYKTKDRDFESSYLYLKKMLDKETVGPHLRVLQQAKLPVQTDAALEMMYDLLGVITHRGGEGLMVRKPEAYWMPKRVDTILKVKKFFDAEGTVIGYTWANEGKIYGKMGALILNWNGKVMQISGFTDQEREMSGFDKDAKPGSQVKEGFYNPLFPIGTVVTFKYQDLSNDGIPNHARYWRKHQQS